jgi:FkbM family methyltransferase
MRRLLFLPYYLLWLWRHPMNRGRRLRAYRDWLAWQLFGRARGGRTLSWVNDVKVEVKPGMTVFTPSIPTGLAEYDVMAFTLHLLRPGDLLADVGANAGAFTLLAHAAGARAVAFEPAAETLPALYRNLALNGIEAEVIEAVVSDRPGALAFSVGEGTKNRVVAEGGATRPAVTLDAALAGRAPTLVKIDVEGHEAAVCRGGPESLATAQAAIVEIWGETGEAHAALLAAGLRPAAYDPFARTLTPLDAPPKDSNNAIYVRDIEWSRARVAAAPRFKLLGGREI